MKLGYFVNSKTRCMHVEGFCKDSKVHPFEAKYFETEDKARAYYGATSVRMCKNCQKKIDQMMREVSK